MNFNGKKFSEIILEQKAPVSPYGDVQNPTYNKEEDIWEFPEIEVLSKKPKIRSSYKINFNTNGSVESVEIKGVEA
jgi:hypothetical protein